MTIKRFNVLGIGNAIIDVFVQGDESLLERFHLAKKTMSLINEQKAEQMYKTLPISKEMSGGGEANVVAAVTSFGGTGAFIGKVKADMLGQRFIDKLHGRGVEFSTEPNEAGSGTGRCFIIVTPDGSRTMCTYLGASTSIKEEDIDEKLIHASTVMYISGYLWDHEDSRNAIKKAIEIAEQHDTRIAFSLADKLCTERHRDDFLKIVEDHADIVFANKLEVNALFNTEDHNKSVQEIAKYCANGKIAALTCSADGVIIVSSEGVQSVEGTKVVQVVDTTGAGAVFAGGFLYAYSHNYDLTEAAKLANQAAAQSVTTLGARPTSPLSDLLNSA